MSDDQTDPAGGDGSATAADDPGDGFDGDELDVVDDADADLEFGDETDLADETDSDEVVADSDVEDIEDIEAKNAARDDSAAVRPARPRRSAPGRKPAVPAPTLNFSLPKIDLRVWLSTAGEGVRTLLSRPLTSFHLVVGLSVILTILGLIMVQSASSVEGYSNKQSAYGAFTMQAIFAVLGWIAFYLVLRLPISFFRRVSGVLVAASLVLLALVLVPSLGVEVDGARRWFDVAGVSIQPSELAKLALCLWGAHILATRRSANSWGRELLFPLVYVAGAMVALIILEPNLSTTVVIAIITGALLWFGGLPGRVFAMCAGAFAALAVIAAFSADYRASRVFSFIGNTDDPLGDGYQALQAKYALANGGIFGVGLGQSTAKWNYLPNAHNDFIFAILVEETGLVGGMVVVGLFLLLGFVGMRIALRSADPFLRLLTGTITVLITAQMFINVGYVVGLLPVTGIQLPLLSQGGTSMLTMLIMLALMASAARHEPEAVAVLIRKKSGRLHLPPPAAYRPARSTTAGARPVRRRPATPAPARPRAHRSGEIHYSARQASNRVGGDPRRSATRGRTVSSPRRTEYRHR